MPTGRSASIPVEYSKAQNLQRGEANSRDETMLHVLSPSGFFQKRTEFARHIGAGSIAVVSQHTIARHQLVSATHEAPVQSEWPNSDNAPVGHEPGELGVITRVGKHCDPGDVSAPDGATEIDPTRVGAADRHAAGSSAVVLKHSAWCLGR